MSVLAKLTYIIKSFWIVFGTCWTLRFWPNNRTWEGVDIILALTRNAADIFPDVAMAPRWFARIRLGTEHQTLRVFPDFGTIKQHSSLCKYWKINPAKIILVEGYRDWIWLNCNLPWSVHGFVRKSVQELLVLGMLNGLRKLINAFSAPWWICSSKDFNIRSSSMPNLYQFIRNRSVSESNLILSWNGYMQRGFGSICIAA